MNIEVRAYTDNDIEAMVTIWNQVVEDGGGISAGGMSDTGVRNRIFRRADILRSCRGYGHRQNLRHVHPASEQRRTLRPYLQRKLRPFKKTVRGQHIGENW